jgi:hypothetical protein
MAKRPIGLIEVAIPLNIKAIGPWSECCLDTATGEVHRIEDSNRRDEVGTRSFVCSLDKSIQAVQESENGVSPPQDTLETPRCT